MTRKTAHKAEPEAPHADPVAPSTSPAVPETKHATSVATVIVAGQVLRKYTREIHGADFEDLANEFSSHTRGSTVSVL